jgi:glycosyltransferase involved in cell wall biosynthesis
VTIDADGQHVPEEAINVVAPVLENNADIVVGSRYLEHTSRVPRHRILGHRFFNFMSSQASGVSLTDSQSGFRAFSRRALNAIAFRSNGFSVESEMQFLAHDHNLKMVEVPITILYTDKPKRPVLSHGVMVLNGILRLVGQYRPLLFFGLPGLLIILAGLWLGVKVIDIYRSSQVLPVGYALIGILLMVLGNLALFTGIILHSVRGLLLDLVQPKSAETTAEASGTEEGSGDQG